MRVTAVETLRDPQHPEFVWVRIETDSGVVGLGETMPKPLAVEAAIHERLAPLLIGQEVAPEAFWGQAFRSLSYTGYSGAEMRALSAIDIALWDALAQAADLPITSVLGGSSRDSVPAYNTCVGYGDLRDHDRFLSDPAGLVRELVDEGYPAMKIWPFDAYSVAGNGHGISRADLAAGISVVSRIRDAVGTDIEIAIEGHSCWDLPTAITIAKALEPFDLLWFEDPIQATNPSSWRRLADETSVPLCGSERVFTRFDVLPYLTAGAWSIVNQDVAWTGGISEMRKVAALAETFDLSIAPHNCHGPVAAAATVAMGLVLPNAVMVETVRSFERGIHPTVAVGGPVVENGRVRLSGEPGLGVRLLDSFVERCVSRRTTALDLGGATGWASGDPWADGVDTGM